jgi:hypothetical protein
MEVSESGNGNNPEISIAMPTASKRRRGTGPVLVLAMLVVVGALLTWYFSWFGRELSDADISKYLSDVQHPRHVQHALSQIQLRMERGDPSVKQWYPQVVSLARNPETEFRLTAAWVMGFDTRSEEFHQELSKLCNDAQPIVRRNAALALIRFNDLSGRAEVVRILQPYEVTSPAEGVVASTLKEEAAIARGTLLGRVIQSDNKVVEIRSPLPGKIAKIAVQNAVKVAAGQLIMSLKPDDRSVWEALRALALIGQPEDLQVIEPYALDASPEYNYIKQQAALTVKSIKQRNSSQK